ncbi:NAD(P)H-dependent oxidoreductase [Psychromonas sp. B3M02]|uniref:nitroreductase family protein n=1 Tax=Psychromonas sp. B3M02 TaxID=2267226 RepID=UPI000DEAD692|nr:nitroreductase family protein [Psychromonas sp. B3M02]RBW41690.1 NAD(P)H-dependent oxidoreductase [Psychromonas sp. B3M02]
MDFIHALNWRYAVNQFSDKKLNQAQVSGLIESVRLSASAYGLQPYRLFIIESEAVKQKLLPYSFGQNKVANNSHLFVFAHKTTITQDDISTFISQVASSQNRTALDLKGYEQVIINDLLTKTKDERINWSSQQAYIALGKLLSCAAINKIDACPMTGFDNHGINQVLGLNKLGLNAEILCPVGYRSTMDTTSIRAKYRQSIEELVTII